mmetsp:Transcript_9966/g.18801  ORF Transcript_9966/g.18801 Transcript_9966/m.18801 type:complete len:243 (+) Transcript_9966:704-1432(+)
MPRMDPTGDNHDTGWVGLPALTSLVSRLSPMPLPPPRNKRSTLPADTGAMAVCPGRCMRWHSARSSLSTLAIGSISTIAWHAASWSLRASLPPAIMKSASAAMAPWLLESASSVMSMCLTRLSTRETTSAWSCPSHATPPAASMAHRLCHAAWEVLLLCDCASSCRSTTSLVYHFGSTVIWWCRWRSTRQLFSVPSRWSSKAAASARAASFTSGLSTHMGAHHQGGESSAPITTSGMASGSG